MRWRGAATPAGHRRARVDELGDVASELLRADGEHRPVSDHLRKPRVRLYGNRQRSAGEKAPDELQHAVWAKAAVETDNVRMKPFQDGGHAFDARPGQELSVVSERDCREDGEAAVLLGGEDRGLELVGIAHRLHGHEVGACGGADEYIMLALRTSGGVDLALMRERYGLRFEPNAVTAELEKRGLIAVSDRITLSDEGVLLSNSIITELTEAFI